MAWVAVGKNRGTRSLLLGAVAGVLPDVDVMIRSGADPLLAIEHHRGFTHALLFTPIGGLIAALPYLARRREEASRYALSGIAAYASHPLLDSATTYGTQLFLPFSHYRVGLDIISIIDPIFTAVFVFALVAAFAGRLRRTLTALTLAVAWLLLGAVQRERAISAQEQLAVTRGETRVRGAVFPTLGNTIVWRSLYQSEGVLRIDRIRVPWFGRAEQSETASVAVASPPTSRSDPTGHGVRDFERFAWFSDGWVAYDPDDSTVIGDARYSLRSDAYRPVWGIRFHGGSEPHTEWVNRTRERRVSPADLWNELTGRGGAFRPIV